MSNNETPQPTQSQPPKDTKAIGFGLHVNLGYIKSIPAILTAAIMLVSLIAFICVYAGRNNFSCEFENFAAFNFFGFVAMTAFITGLITYILFVFGIDEKLNMVPWKLGILIWSGIWAVLYLIASALTAAKACGQSGVIAGAIFGFLTMVFLGARAFFAFMEYRVPTPSQPAERPPQEYTRGTDFVQY